MLPDELPAKAWSVNCDRPRELAVECLDQCRRSARVGQLSRLCRNVCELGYTRRRIQALEGKTRLNKVYFQGDRQMQPLQQLKSFDPAGYSVEEMVLLLCTAQAMIAAFKTLGEVPEWLTDAEKSLRKEIDMRMRDELERQLKEVTAREEALKTKEEQRSEMAEKRKRLEARLKGTPAVVTAS